MNPIETGRGQASKPFDLDEFTTKTAFEKNLKEGNKFEAGVRYLLALEGIASYGVEPGTHEDGTKPNYAKEQKDIVLYRETLFIPDAPWNNPEKQFTLPELREAAEDWRRQLIQNDLRFIEVKSFSKPFYPSIMLDCAKTWYQKDPEPTAVVLVQQSATLWDLGTGAREHILVAHIPTVRGALKEKERKVWDKATQTNRLKTNIEVPKELCWGLSEFLDRARAWAQNPEAPDRPYKAC